MINDLASANILVFELAGRRYALREEAVVEVTAAVSAFPLPKAPPIVEGVINLRGVVVPVLDLRARFGLAPKAVEPDDHLIIARAGGRRVAVRADRAVGLAAIPDGGITPPAEVSAGTEFVAGIVKLPDGLVLIHDLSSFLSQAEAARLDDALPGSAAR